VTMLEHPAIAFLVAALVVPFLPKRLAGAVVVAAPVAGFGLLLRLGDAHEASVELFGYQLQHLRLDGLSTPFAYIFLLVALLAGLFGMRTMAATERSSALLYAGAGLAVVLAGDLLTLFLAWEAKALASTVLVAASGRTAAADAAFRYLIVHVIGGSLLLGGIVWHVAAGGTLGFDALSGHPSAHLVLLAFLLSAAVPPLHAWLPDAYPEASVAGTVFLSAYTTKAAVYALLRGFSGTEVLVAVGVVMALYGVVYAVLENDIRRLLGYHIISQVGYMVAAVGIGTAAAVNGATAHAFAHILYKGLLLMGAGAILHATGRSKLTELGGLARAMPWVLGLYLVGAVSISGFPLFSGFVSKELVVDAARGDGRDLVVHLLKLASVGTFLHTGLKLPWFAFGGPDRGIQCRPVPTTMVVAMALTALANTVIGVRPDLLYGLLPFPVDYEPYSLAKLAEITQLLVFTALAFWLLAKKLGGEPTITLDTDWLYRRESGDLADTGRAAGACLGAATRAVIAPAGRVPARAALARMVGGSPAPGAPPTVVPTSALGTAVVAAAILVLGWGLIR
jgi:multicomponent Na+:H+ antiporter subunit D